MDAPPKAIIPPQAQVNSRMLPPRPSAFLEHPSPTVPSSAGPPTRRKLPEIPKSAKLSHRPAIPHEPHYPSSFHSSFDEGQEAQSLHQHSSNPHLSSSNVPAPTIYESYHQQFRQFHRQQSSPMGSRQLPMAPFGHRRTASSGNFAHHDQTSPAGKNSQQYKEN